MILRARRFDGRSLGRVLTPVLLIALLGLQAWFGDSLRGVPPSYRDMAAPPSPTGLVAAALGDDQAAFRMRSLGLQHVGGLDGRMLGFREIDLTLVADWLFALDALDPRSGITATMAGFLFRDPVNPEEVRPLVDFLVHYAKHDPKRNWRWMAQAAHLSHYHANDTDRAILLARDLARWPGPVPPWARQLEVFMLTDIGERDAAERLLLSILETDENLPETEREWISYYIQRRLR